MDIMTAVAVVPVAFRLIDERLMVWVQPPGNGSGSARVSPNGAASLPQTDVASDESHVDALRRILSSLPFSHDVARVKHCAVFAEPERVPGRREIALVSWVLVRAAPHHEVAPAYVGSAHGGTANGIADDSGDHDDHAGEHAGYSGSNGVQLAPVRQATVERLGERAGTGDGLDRTGWYPVDDLPPMIHDHKAIIAAADRHLSGEVLHDTVTRRVLPKHLLRSAVDELVLHEGQTHQPPAVFGLLPDPFPLSAIRRFYERLLGTEIDRGNFRRKLVELRPTGMIKELPIFQRGVRHRAAQLFTFDARAWERWAAADETE
jgi:AraR C-terminal winged HTH domain